MDKDVDSKGVEKQERKSSKQGGNKSAKTSLSAAKNISSTPPTVRTDFDKTKIDSSTNLETFDSGEEEENLQYTTLEKSHSAKNKYKDKENIKLSKFSYTPNASGESLYQKMPNFIQNYENLMEMITNSNTGSESKSAVNSNVRKKSLEIEENPPVNLSGKKKSNTQVKSKIFGKSKEGTASNPPVHIDHLITSVAKKAKPDPEEDSEEQKEERCIILKSLTNTEDIKDFYQETEECLKRIVKLKVTPVEEIEHLMVTLPFEEELKTKRLAVFDLDETLVHCEIKNPKRGQFQIQVKIPSGAITNVGLNVRPLWKESLAEIQKNYVIVVYTASHQSYADSVLNFLDPDKEYIQYRLYRHNCARVKVENDFIYVKDMRIFKNVHPKDIIIIDNSVLSFAFQLENGIPILPYYNNKDDEELSFLSSYLNRIANSNDLREENKKSFKMDYFLQATVDESVCEMESEGDISSEHKEVHVTHTEEKKSDSNKNVFHLNVCDEKVSEENSLDNSLNLSLSYNSITKEDLLKDTRNSKFKMKYKISDNAFKRNSVIQGQLINTLFELKKSLEENLRNKSQLDK